jgi:hypothetical protein
MGTRENDYNDVEQTLRNGNSMGTRENHYNDVEQTLRNGNSMGTHTVPIS